MKRAPRQAVASGDAGAGAGGKAPPSPGRVDVARLVPVRQLGRGTLCEVMLVEDDRGARYALKRALPEHRANSGVARLLRDEARVMQMLEHASIPKLIAFDDANDGPQLIFELLDGTTLDEVLPKKAALSTSSAAFVVDVVLDALAHVHTKGVVHRDVGPHNVVVTRTGDVALIDFGIAKDEDRERWTAAGAVRGTLGYLAPEAVRGEDIDARADLFATGALFYRTLTGSSPFRGKGPRQILNAVAEGDFVKAADVDDTFAKFDAFFARALAAQPAQRFQNANEMRASLSKLVVVDRARERNALSVVVTPHLASVDEARGPTLS